MTEAIHFKMSGVILALEEIQGKPKCVMQIESNQVFHLQTAMDEASSFPSAWMFCILKPMGVRKGVQLPVFLSKGNCNYECPHSSSQILQGQGRLKTSGL